MKSVLSLLGGIAGTLSIVSLLVRAFNVGLGSTATLISTYHENFMRAALGWAEPPILARLHDLGDYFGWHLALHPHWRHVFLLLGIYFFRESWNAYNVGNIGNSLAYACWGVLVAFLASIAAGTVAISDHDSRTDFLIAAYPIAGILLFDLGVGAWRATWMRERYAEVEHREVRTWSHEFFRTTSVAGVRFLIALAFIQFGLSIPFVRNLPNPGIAVLFGMIVGLAIWWLVLGVWQTNMIREPDERWRQAFARNVNTRLGIAMILTFVGVTVFLILNAGLQLIGL